MFMPDIDYLLDSNGKKVAELRGKALQNNLILHNRDLPIDRFPLIDKDMKVPQKGVEDNELDESIECPRTNTQMLSAIDTKEFIFSKHSNLTKNLLNNNGAPNRDNVSVFSS
jgi:hypothetical protein